MTTRGKTTPASTGGSFSAHAGARSRVTAPDGEDEFQISPHPLNNRRFPGYTTGRLVPSPDMELDESVDVIFDPNGRRVGEVEYIRERLTGGGSVYGWRPVGTRFGLTDKDDAVANLLKKAAGRGLPTGVYLTDSKSLTGVMWATMPVEQAEREGIAADGHSIVVTPNGARRYVRDTGKTLAARGAVGPLAVFEAFEVTTEVAEIDGRSTIIGRPGEPAGKMFIPANATLP